MAETLIVVPSVVAALQGNTIFLDRKAVDGLRSYSELWPGPVRCLMRAGDPSSIAFGEAYRQEDLPFAIRIITDPLGHTPNVFDDAAVILLAGDNHQDLLLADGVTAPIVYVIEYTLATRLRINRLVHGLSFQALKSAVWTIGVEWQRRRAFRHAAGLQCNGVPAYRAYRKSTSAPLLYFDTRTTESQQITHAALVAKQEAIGTGAPLRIAFSGRLEIMKGADHLLPVVEALADLGVPFTLDIYGDGQLRAAIAQRIVDIGFTDRVALHGPVSFADVLTPALIERTDLFLCCHRQADPSCTYMETLSCGVPIVGYDNAAFAGIKALDNIGVCVRMDDVGGAARAIAALADDRSRLASMAAKAAAVGREHSFEREFANRVSHLQTLAKQPR